jgi:hypothetical protein
VETWADWNEEEMLAPKCALAEREITKSAKGSDKAADEAQEHADDRMTIPKITSMK